MNVNSVTVNCTVISTVIDKDGLWINSKIKGWDNDFRVMVFAPSYKDMSGNMKMPNHTDGDLLMVHGTIASKDGSAFHIRSSHTMKVSQF